MLGLTDLLTQTVQKLRVKELNLASKYRRLLSCRVFLGEASHFYLQDSARLTITR